jgi:dolichol kinase
MTAEVGLAMGLVAAGYLGMFGVGELLHRRWQMTAETTRKLDHFAGGAIALALPLAFDTPWPVVVLAAGFLGFLTGALVLGSLGSVHSIGRRSVGAFLYPLSIAVVFVLSANWCTDYAIAILALATADVAAGIVGQRWGRHAYAAWGHGKTLEGSAAAFAVTAVVCAALLLFGGASIVVAGATGIFTGVVVALVEGALPWGLDNLGIPLAVLLSLSAAGSIVSAAVVLLGAALLFGTGLAATRLNGTLVETRQPETGP